MKPKKPRLDQLQSNETQETNTPGQNPQRQRHFTNTAEARNSIPTDPCYTGPYHLNRFAGEHNIFGTGGSLSQTSLSDQQQSHQQNQESLSGNLSSIQEWQHSAQNPSTLVTSHFWREQPHINEQQNRTTFAQNQHMASLVEAWQTSAYNPQMLTTTPFWEESRNTFNFDQQEILSDNSQQQHVNKGKQPMNPDEQDQITTDEIHARQIIYNGEQRKRHAQTRVGTSYIEIDEARRDFANETSSEKTREQRTPQVENQQNITSPTQNLSLPEIQAHCDNIITSVRNSKPIYGLKLNAQGFDTIIAEFRKRKEINPTEEDLIDKAIERISKKKYDQIGRQKKAQSEGYNNSYDRRNSTSIKETGKTLRQRQNEASIKNHSKTLRQRQNEASIKNHSKTPYQRKNEASIKNHGKTLWQRRNEASIEKHGKTPYQRQNEASIEKHGKTLWQRRKESAESKGFSNLHQELNNQAQTGNFNNISDMLSQQAIEQNLTIPYSALQNFEGLLQTQNTLNDALQEQTITQSNEPINQQEDSLLLTPHLQQQINDLDTHIENLLRENETIGYLLYYNQSDIEYYLDQLEASHNLPETNPD